MTKYTRLPDYDLEMQKITVDDCDETKQGDAGGRTELSNNQSLKEENKNLTSPNNTEQNLILGSLFTLLVVSTPSAFKIILKQMREFEKELYVNFENNYSEPLNKNILILAHNAATQKGNTIVGFENQSMPTTDLLSLTSLVNRGVAGVSYPIMADKDKDKDKVKNWFVNHGAASNKISSPLKVESELNEINTWIEQNPGSLVYIRFSNQEGTVIGKPWATEDQKQGFSDMIKNTFAGKLFTRTDLHKYREDCVDMPYREDCADMPSKEWLLLNGYSVIAVTEKMGGNLVTIPDVDTYTNKKDEDRASLLSFVGSWFQRNGIIKTGDIEEINNGHNHEGVIIGMDFLDKDDPRIIEKSMRDKLEWEQNMSMFEGILPFSRGIPSIMAFCFGLILNEAPTIFAISNAIQKASLNNQYIKNLDANIESMITNIDATDLELFKKNNKMQRRDNDKDLIIDYCKHQALEKITRDTLIAGISATTALGGSITSLSNMFPKDSSLIGIIGVTILVLGLAGTSFGVVANRNELWNKLDKVLEGKEDLIKNKVTSLSSPDIEQGLSTTEFTIEQGLQAKQDAALLASISDIIYTMNLVSKFGAMGKYSFSSANIISGAFGAAAAGASGLMNIVKSYKDTNENYENLPKYIVNLLVAKTDIYKKSFFSKDSKLDNYVKNNYELGNNEVRDYLNELEGGECKKVIRQCFEHYLKEDIEAYLKKQKKEPDDEGIKSYIKERATTNAWRNNFFSSLISVAKFSGALLTASSVVPLPIRNTTLSFAAAVGAAGLLGAVLNANHNEYEFSREINQLFNSNEGNKYKEISAEAMKKLVAEFKGIATREGEKTKNSVAGGVVVEKLKEGEKSKGVKVEEGSGRG